MKTKCTREGCGHLNSQHVDTGKGVGTGNCKVEIGYRDVGSQRALFLSKEDLCKCDQFKP